MKRLSLSLLLAFVFGIFISGMVFAQDNQPPTDDEVNAIAKKLYCPVCESTPLDVCPTEACKDWREQIRVMLADGKTEDEILQHFVDQYGDRVLSSPPATGFNWLIYIIPPVLILTGAVILFRSLKGWTKARETRPSQSDERSGVSSIKKDDYVSRFEEEAKKKK